MSQYVFGATRSHGMTTLAAVTVATGTAVRLAATPIATGTEAKQGIILQADSGNSGTIYVGGPTVTAANGIQLPAGASTTVPVGDPYFIFAIASASSQTLRINYV